MLRHVKGLPWWFRGKESTGKAGDAGDMGLILGSGRSPGEGNGNPQQYSCLENLMDRGAWWATVHGVTKSWAQLSLTDLILGWQVPKRQSLSWGSSCSNLFDLTLPCDRGGAGLNPCPPQYPPIRDQMLERTPGGRSWVEHILPAHLF